MRELPHYPQSVCGAISQYSEDVVQTETAIPLFADWRHLHSSEMLLAMGPIAAHLLEEREALARIVRASFSGFSKNQMMIFAARRLLTPNNLGLKGSKPVTSSVIETSAGGRIHILGLETDKPVQAHVNKNHIAAALSSRFAQREQNGSILVFPIHSARLGTSLGENVLAGVALAHELLIQSWDHFPETFIPNRGFAWQVNYSNIPSRAELACADTLQIDSENWEGREAGNKPFSIVDIPFEFSKSGEVVCAGTYKHLHPNSPADKERMLQEAGITS